MKKCLMRWPNPMKSSEGAGEFYLFWWFVGKEYLVFLRLSDKLLTLNQFLTFVSSLFIFSTKILLSQCEKKRFAASANIIRFSTFEAWCKSFTYNRNNRGPKKDPWQTPHVTVAFLNKTFFKKKKLFSILQIVFKPY